MKAWSILLCALIVVAPAAALCACAAPSVQGCEGMDHCCCGDASSKSSRSEDCPRAEKSTDPAETSENSMEPRITVVAVLPCFAFNFDLPGSTASSRAESG